MVVYIFTTNEEKNDNNNQINNEEVNNKDDSQNNEGNNNIDDTLSIDDEIVIETYKKVPTGTLNTSTVYWKDLTNTVYLSIKQTYDTLTKKFIMENVLSHIESSDFTPIYDINSQGPFKLQKSTLEEKIKYIYGDVDFDLIQYNSENGITATGGDVGTGLRINDLYCNKYVDEEYYCYPFNAGGIVILPEEYRKLVKVEEDENYLYLYDYHLVVAPIYSEEGTITDNYSIHVDENAMVGMVTRDEYFAFDDKYEGLMNKIGDKAKLYKHTFKKDNTGNYYWISTEQEK